MKPKTLAPKTMDSTACLASRRQFLHGALAAGAGVGLTSLAAGCAKATASPGSAGADAAAQGSADSADGASPCPPTADAGAAQGPPGYVAPTGPALDVTGLPFRQDDPNWGAELMWDRALVIKAAVQFNGETKADAGSLLREFEDGNNIANEGCQLSCFAMILRLLAPAAKPAWTPKTLNSMAHELYYYTLCGLSMTTLYADLVAEVTEGAVQLCLKEEYLPGEPGWPKQFAHTSPLVRAYRSLTPGQRSNFVVMLKTGTYDDTVASHYVLLHPDDAGGPAGTDPEILDPAKPLAETKAWHLSDSAKAITQDPDIAAGWAAGAIEPTQIGGVWVFARWSASRDRSLLAPLVHAWAAQLLA